MRAARQQLRHLATVATRAPRRAALSVAAVAIAGACLALFGPLDVSTSRRNLVSADDPVQARLFEFFDDFGRPDAAVFVVMGGEPAGRRAVAGALTERLERLPELADRVLGHIGPLTVAEVLALHRPEMVGGLAMLAPAEADGRAGLATMASRLADQIDEALEGDAPDDGRGAEDAGELSHLSTLVGALDDALRGEGHGSTLVALAAASGLSAQSSMDAEGHLTGDDGEHLLVAAFPQLPSDEGADVAPVVDALRALRDEALAEASALGVTAPLTGLPALATDELRIVQDGIAFTGLLTAFGIFLLLLLAFRSLRQTLIVLMPLGAGVLVTVGVVELLYDGLNLVTSSFLSVLMGLGIDIGVHLVYRWREDRRAGADNPASIVGALVHAGPGVTTGAVTTAVAFLTTTTTEFTAYAELGVVTAIGLGVMLVCAFLLLPPLLSWRPSRKVDAAPDLPGVSTLMSLVARRPRSILVAAVVVTGVAVAFFLPAGPGFHGRYFDFLPDETESYEGLLAVERGGEMGPAVVYIPTGSLPEARALSAKLRALPEVGRVHSPTDLLPELDAKRLAALRTHAADIDPDTMSRLTVEAPPEPEALSAALTRLRDAVDEIAFALTSGGRDAGPAHALSKALGGLGDRVAGLDDAGRARLAEIERDLLAVARRALRTATTVAARGHYAPEDLPPIFRERFVSKDGARFAVHAYPSGDIWDEAFGVRFGHEILAIAPNAAGMGLDVHRHQAMIVEGFLGAAGWAAIAVLLLLLIVFRRVSDALLAMMPVLVGWVWMLGAMEPLGLSFNVANLVALPLLLGIGLDAGAHMIHRYRESLDEKGERAHLSDLVRGTGAAVIISSLTTMVGFGALMAAEYGAMRSFGLLLVVGIGFSLLVAVLVLPALLVVLGRAE